ncbi:MAG TPA: DUF3224 domain-containing protein [Caulobacteraceae bacterium]|jgi:hypothetical protein
MRMAALLFAATVALAPVAQAEAPTMQHARGTFDVTVTPVPPAEGAPAYGHMRLSIAKTFHGDIRGTSSGEMLGSQGPENSGAYVALEVVTGTLGGRSGTFALAHRGLMDAGATELSIVVVPGSGTGELTGLTGTFDLKIEGGEHRYDLSYTLPGAE